MVNKQSLQGCEYGTSILQQKLGMIINNIIYDACFEFCSDICLRVPVEVSEGQCSLYEHETIEDHSVTNIILGLSSSLIANLVAAIQVYI